jgi:hypothetical protein
VPDLRTHIGSPSDLQQRYGLLLLAIITVFAVEGISGPGPVKQVIVSALLGSTLMLSLWAAEAKPTFTRPAFVVVVALVAASIGESAAGNVDGNAQRIANLLLVTLAPPAIVIGVLRSLRARNRVTVEAVFGVLCLYILLGLFFASTFGVIGRFSGGFFTGGVEPTIQRCVYYSFTTLTTVGYGDLTASSNLGHTLSVFEALLGQIYLVTVVSLIVGNLGRSRR